MSVVNVTRRDVDTDSLGTVDSGKRLGSRDGRDVSGSRYRARDTQGADFRRLQHSTTRSQSIPYAFAADLG